MIHVSNQPPVKCMLSSSGEVGGSGSILSRHRGEKGTLAEGPRRLWKSITSWP